MIESRKRSYCGRFDKWQTEEDKPLPCQLKIKAEREGNLHLGIVCSLREDEDGTGS